MSAGRPAPGLAAVGAFVLGGVVLAVAAVLLFGKLRLFDPAKKAAIVFQGAVSGLSVGAPVTFRGVHVGSVVSVAIEFDQTAHTAFIPVIIELEPDNVGITQQDRNDPAYLQHVVAAGLRAELAVQSFVTGSEIELDFDPSAPAALHPTLTTLLEIPTRPSQVDKVKDQLAGLNLHELTDDATSTLKSLRSLSDRMDVDLSPLIASLKATSDRSAQAIDAMTSTVESLQGQVGATLAAFAKVAATGDRELDQRGAELHALLTRTDETMSRANAVLGDVRGLTSDRSSSRVNVEAALSDLASAAASLRGLASDVEQDPRLILSGRRP